MPQFFICLKQYLNIYYFIYFIKAVLLFNFQKCMKSMNLEMILFNSADRFLLKHVCFSRFDPETKLWSLQSSDISILSQSCISLCIQAKLVSIPGTAQIMRNIQNPPSIEKTKQDSHDAHLHDINAHVSIHNDFQYLGPVTFFFTLDDPYSNLS